MAPLRRLSQDTFTPPQTAREVPSRWAPLAFVRELGL